MLLGVCCSRAGEGSSGYEEVTLQPLPLYAAPADNVAMVTVAPTAGGRIFLGGADGHLYELQYAAADGWRSKRCSKVGGWAGLWVEGGGGGWG